MIHITDIMRTTAGFYGELASENHADTDKRAYSHGNSGRRNERNVCGKTFEREKRNGTVAKISNGLYSFDIDLFDANEAFPWIKTFIGRIAAFETTNEELQDKFDSDIARFFMKYTEVLTNETVFGNIQHLLQHNGENTEKAHCHKG